MVCWQNFDQKNWQILKLPVFLTYNCNTVFTNYVLPSHGKNFNLATRCTGKTCQQKTCQNIQNFQFLCNFSNVVALPEQDMLHTERTCEANPAGENSLFLFLHLCQICSTLPFKACICSSTYGCDRILETQF